MTREVPDPGKIAVVKQLGLSNPIRSRDTLPPRANRVELIFRQDASRCGFSILTEVRGIRCPHDRSMHA